VQRPLNFMSRGSSEHYASANQRDDSDTGWQRVDAGESPDFTAARPSRFLSALPPETFLSVAPHLEAVRLNARAVLWEPNAPIEWAYFPRNAVASITVPLPHLAGVKAGTVGTEGLVGVPLILGSDRTASRAVVEVAGDAFRMSADNFRRLLAEESRFRNFALRYAQAFLEQVSQSVACNTRHGLRERCARWLLMTHDRIGGTEIMLTHSFLAQMLGVRRAGVTVVAGTLQRDGVITYSRGRVRVLDREALESAACECYGSVAESYNRLLGSAA